MSSVTMPSFIKVAVNNCQATIRTAFMIVGERKLELLDKTMLLLKLWTSKNAVQLPRDHTAILTKTFEQLHEQTR